jgi:hypothetical protein
MFTVFETNDISEISLNECLLGATQKDDFGCEYVSISPCALNRSGDCGVSSPLVVAQRIRFDEDPKLHIEHTHVRILNSPTYS